MGLVLVAGVVGARGTWAQEASRPDAVPEAARSAAQEWLGLLAEQEYEDSWEAAAPAFRAAVEREAWVQRSTTFVDSLGAPRGRTALSAQARDSLRRATGPVVVLRYRARVAAGPVEEVVLLTRADDEWAVAGYHVTSLRRAPLPVQLSPGTGPASRD